MGNHQDNPWLAWAIELQALAQAGLVYSKDPFDIERFGRIREVAAEMLAVKSGLDLERVKDLFCNETGYQTPKLDTRAAVFREGKILLVQERDRRWSLPGGWVDVNVSVGDNTVREVKEEAGLDVVPVRVIALHDRNRHNEPPYAYGICKVFVLCEERGGAFQENIETLQIAFFGKDDLPPLAEEKNSAAQIYMCFDAAEDPNWQTLLD